MTSKERMEKAVTFAGPDRPPIDLPNIAPGVSLYKEELQLESNQAVAEFFGADTIRLEPDYIGPEPYPDWGFKHEKSHMGSIQVVFPCKDMSVEEIRNLPCPPASSADWWDYAGYAKKCEPYSDKAVLTSTGHSIYNWAMALLGPQDETLMMMYTDPDRVNAALDRMTDFHAEFVERLLTASDGVPQYVFFNDDVCTQRGPLYSPDMYKEFNGPRVKRIADIVHGHGRRFIQHCCGAVGQLAELFIEAGIDLIQPLQPGLPGNDVVELRERLGKRAVLFRGLDMQEQMRHDSPEQIYEFYSRLKDKFSDGGLVFNVWPMVDIPLKNMLAFRKAMLGTDA